MQNVSFNGRSVLFVSEKKAEDLAEKISRSRRNMISSKIGFHRSTPTSVDISQNELMVMVRNEKNGIITRFHPGSEHTQKILLDIADTVENLKKSAKAKMTAWIMGGRPKDDKTIKAVNDVAEILCDKPNIDTSILTGQNLGYTEKVIINGMADTTEIIIPYNKAFSDARNFDDIFEITELNNVETKMID